MPKKYDFCGYATKNDVTCSDGKIIKQNAFKDQDGTVVPLVWNHGHTTLEDVIGHAVLENREDGVYAYCSLNDTPNGELAKKIISHGDCRSLSIWANKLVKSGSNILHGAIREVSLVLAGANPGAFIENVELAHGENLEDEEIFCFGEVIEHTGLKDDEDEIEEEDEKSEEESEEESEESDESDEKDKDDEETSEEVEHSEKEGEEKMADKTVKEVWDSMNEDQQKLCQAMVGAAATEKAPASGEAEDEEEDEKMAHNLFEGVEDQTNDVLSHSAMEEIIHTAKSGSKSLKESYLNFCEDKGLDTNSLQHGITDVDMLFPDYKNVFDKPVWIKREPSGWVEYVMRNVHKSPFSRIKSMAANITEDEARAKGYIKGNLKKEEVFTLLKRTTDPQTIYKKQKMDRDDIVDITDFDVVAWIKGEMRMMLDEEIARAILIGDGRSGSDDDKISVDHIRPIATDAELYTIQATVTKGNNQYKDFIKACRRAKKDYRGTGNPTLFAAEDFITECLLIEDSLGHIMYETEADLAKACRVKEVVSVSVLENAKGASGNDLAGIIVNLTDYNVGADKGGSVTLFDDFDIDYNAQKYLIETRMSGALVRPYSAIAITLVNA